MTLVRFLEHHEQTIRQPDIHRMNIIDRDIGTHKKTKNTHFRIQTSKKNIHWVILTPQECITH